MKQFTDIQENLFIDTPAAVCRKTGVLYINPRYFDKLSQASKNFVIAHEYGHLQNNSSNEKAADEYALWKRIGLGDDSISVLKSFYDALPFTTDEQIERGEKLLRSVFKKEFDAGKSSAKTFLDIIEAKGSDIDCAGGRIAQKIGKAVSSVGGVIAMIPVQPICGVIGGAVSAAGAVTAEGGNIAAAVAAGKEAYAQAKHDIAVQQEQELDSLKNQNYISALKANREANEAVAQAEDLLKKKQTKKKVITAIVLIIVAVGCLLILNKK